MTQSLVAASTDQQALKENQELIIKEYFLIRSYLAVQGLWIFFSTR